MLSINLNPQQSKPAFGCSLRTAKSLTRSAACSPQQSYKTGAQSSRTCKCKRCGQANCAIYPTLHHIHALCTGMYGNLGKAQSAASAPNILQTLQQCSSATYSMELHTRVLQDKWRTVKQPACQQENSQETQSDSHNHRFVCCSKCTDLAELQNRMWCSSLHNLIMTQSA